MTGKTKNSRVVGRSQENTRATPKKVQLKSWHTCRDALGCHIHSQSGINFGVEVWDFQSVSRAGKNVLFSKKLNSSRPNFPQFTLCFTYKNVKFSFKYQNFPTVSFSDSYFPYSLYLCLNLLFSSVLSNANACIHFVEYITAEGIYKWWQLLFRMNTFHSPVVSYSLR